MTTLPKFAYDAAHQVSHSFVIETASGSDRTQNQRESE